MDLNYVIYYTEACAICIVILLILYVTDKVRGTQQEKQIWFHRAIIAFVLYFTSDAGWAAVLGGVLPGTRSLVVMFNLTNYIVIGIVAYEWFMFMAVSEKMPFSKSRLKRIYWTLPLVISDLVMLVAYFIRPYFWIGENGELSEWYYPMMLAAPGFYLLVALIISMVNTRRAESREEKHLYRLIGIFPMGIIAFGLIQVIWLHGPTFCFGCTVMLIFFYIQNLQTLVSIDDLTRLNNRGQIDRCMDQIKYKENEKTFIMMIDVDGFKKINDTYGHSEGDQALILVAEVLKQICDGCGSHIFLGRYGGDEFTIIFQDPLEAEHPAKVAEAIREGMVEIQQENQLPYELKVSIGYSELKGGEDTMQKCMIRADEALYEEKRSKGAQAVC